MSTLFPVAFISMPGGSEMMIIFIAVLLLFGAKKIPELTRGMGKAMGEFKSARREFEQELRRAEYEVRADPKRQIASTSTHSSTASPKPAASASASAKPAGDAIDVEAETTAVPPKEDDSSSEKKA